MPVFPVLYCLLEFVQVHVHWVGDVIQPSPPLSFPSSPPSALNLSQHQGLFQWVGSSHQVSKVLELHLQHQSFQWTPRTDLFAVQGTLKSLLQHHSSKASILRHSAFFMVQCSHPYMTTGKTMAFTNVVHWIWEWQTTSVSLLGEPQESMKRQKDMTPEDEPPRLIDGFRDPRLSP